MGLLRLLLAASVFVAHSQPVFGLSAPADDGHLAVQAFFILSGFYMAMVLHEKYKTKHSFYKSRCVRLYPAYFFILIIGTIVRWNTLPSFHIDVLPFALFLFSNITMIGLDVLQFLGIRDGHLYFVYDTRDFLSAFSYTIISPAWSLGTEIWFYALAPFLVKQKWFIILGVLLLSVLGRFSAYAAGLIDINWQYHYFPFEIAVFLAGALSYRFYRLIKHIHLSPVIQWGCLACLLVSTWSMPPALLYEGIICLCAPLAFLLTKNWKWDRFIGDLTYPFYLMHLMFIDLFNGVIPTSWIFCLCIALSVPIVLFIERPFQRFR